MEHTYQKSDIPIEEVNHKFITDYEFYLKTARKCAHNTATKYLKNFKKIIRIALANDYITKDPFANKGYCRMRQVLDGWFFVFKLHLMCNERGELLSFLSTPANTDDREPLSNESFIKDIKGKIFGDKGYISSKLFERLFVGGIQLITKVKKNMKNAFISYSDKILLCKRAIIESVNDELKNICQIEHSRHRSIANFIVNFVADLAAYCFLPKNRQ